MNDTTRRHPRTMNEAFGPYARLDDAPPPMHQHDRIVVNASIIAAIIMVLVIWVA